jgi:hypothetical protein
MLKTTQAQLKRDFKKQIVELKAAIWLKCGDCLGFFLDPYEPCTSKECPLRKHFPQYGTVRSKAFKEKLVELAEAYHNDQNIVARIRNSRPSLVGKTT